MSARELFGLEEELNFEDMDFVEEKKENGCIKLECYQVFDPFFKQPVEKTHTISEKDMQDIRAEVDRLREIEKKYKNIMAHEDEINLAFKKAKLYDGMVGELNKLEKKARQENVYQQRKAEAEENTRRRFEWEKDKDAQLKYLQKRFDDHGDSWEELQRVRGLVNPY